MAGDQSLNEHSDEIASTEEIPNNHTNESNSDSSLIEANSSDSNDDEVMNSDDEDSEIEALDRQLDQLNNCLDVLEQQNDLLTVQLQDLLESNRQARLEFTSLQKAQDENNQSGNSS